MKKYYYFTIFLLISFVSFSQNWGLDQDFNTVGYTITNLITNGDDYAESLAIQNDGKILVAGFGLRLVRYNTDGTLDTTFNGVGYTAPYGSNTSLNEINQIIVKPDNKILVIGTIYTSKFYLYLAQYNTNGTLDTTFGSGGRKNIDIGNTITFLVGNAVFTSDNKIVISANSFISDGDYTLIRCTSTGSLDTTFGGTGIVTIDGLNNDGIGKIAIRSDGKLLLAGNANSNPTSGNYKQHFLTLINDNGSLDSTFGTNGKVFTNFNTNNTQSIHSMTLLNDNKIIIGGEIIDLLNNQNDFFLAKYNSDGSIDTSFGTNGKTSVDFKEFFVDLHADDHCNKITVQNDGKIVAAGFSFSTDNSAHFSLARFSSNGTLDTTFGSDGKMVTSILGYSDAIFDVDSQNDGKIVVCGMSKINQDRAYVVARFTPNSTLSISSEENLNSQIQLFPNPVKNKVNISTIDFQNWKDKLDVTIYSIDGKVLKKIPLTDAKFNNNQLEVDLSDLNSGIYILKLSDGTNQFTRKCIKE